MKPQILVIYYSQSGQLKTILDTILSPIIDKIDVEFKEIIPQKPFPFPWDKESFFGCMPECVQQISEPIQAISFEKKNYDLVILGYQPWFLSPSIPFNSFLQSEDALFLKNQNVLTVIGSRNMWLNAQEKVKAKLIELQATLVGNIVFFDNNPNLLSVLSIDRWTFTGQKEASTFLPEAGVQKRDIQAAARFGTVILENIQLNNFNYFQTNLLKQQAVIIKPGLIILEKRGITNFRKFSKFILEKGERGNKNRVFRVKLFQRLLFIGIFILSPISGFTAKIASILNKKSLEKEVDYFKNISYRKNAI